MQTIPCGLCGFKAIIPLTLQQPDGETVPCNLCGECYERLPSTQTMTIFTMNEFVMNYLDTKLSYEGKTGDLF